MRTYIQTDIDRERCQKILETLKLDGKKKFVFDVKLYRNRRTLPQNSLLWLFYSAIMMQTSHTFTREEWHYHYGHKFLPKKDVMGDMVPVSTKSLDTKQFGDYLQRIYDDALIEHAVELVWPEDKRFMDFYDKYEGAI